MIKKNFLIIISISLLIIIFTELFFYLSWKITSLKYFENLNNYNNKITKTTKITFKKNNTLTNSKEKKIALLGGSNIKGFGSALNIEELLRHKNFINDNNLVVHNYSEYGKTFSGHQSKILKKIIKEYDIFFIYSGHNELFMIQNTSNFKNKKIEYFPNGLRLASRNSLNYNDIDLKNYIKEIQQEFSFKERIINFFKNNSRIYFFTKRVLSRINFIKYKKKVDKKEFSLKRFSHKIDYFNDSSKLEIINFYKKNLDEIIKKINNNQTIVISTLASNDFFSPFGDLKLNENDEIKLDNIYQNLINHKNYSKISIENISDGSNKYYILGMKCLEQNGFTYNTETKKCYDFLINARKLDNIPLRVFPELNEFIRSLSDHPKIEVIDLEIEILKRVKNLEDYLSFFVDFHHLSPKGHLLLSNLLLNKIDKNNKIKNIDNLKIDKCGNTVEIDFKKNTEIKLINVPYERCKWTLLAIKRLLNSHLKYHKKTSFYDHYIKLVN